jgi:flagellar basal-body rod protein FlgB
MVFTMDYSSISLFSIMKSKMSTLTERQSVLAQNIANADTPGYKAMDVEEPNFKQSLHNAHSNSAQSLHSPLQMTATNARHISGGAATSGYMIVKAKTTNEVNPNGNNVVITEEMAKMASNQSEYQKVLNLYSKSVSMFKSALGTPNSGG